MWSLAGGATKKTSTDDQQQKGISGEQAITNQSWKHIPMDWWFEDVCMLDMDYFVRTITAIKAKGVRPDLIGAIISHYAMKWLPGLVQEQETPANLLESHANGREIIGNSRIETGSESFTSLQRKNRFLLETLVGILPIEKDSVSCSFLLRLLRMAKIVEADVLHRVELERRIGLQLEQASLSDLLIPSFGHTSDTLFDVQLVYRIVKRFLAQEVELSPNIDVDGQITRSHPAKLPTPRLKAVAKLLDSYLAEVAHDANLTVSNFEALAELLPSYARTCDDGLYRAIDTYLKAHPGVSEIDRKRLCRIMDCQKLSMDACMHAAQNERLPLRTVVQVLFCEQMRLKNSKSGAEESVHNNDAVQNDGCSTQLGFDGGLCHSHRDASSFLDIRSLLLEIQKMREDFTKLQHLCNSMQQQVDKMCKQKSSIFPWGNGWKKLTKLSAPLMNSTADIQRDDQCSVQLQDPPLGTPLAHPSQINKLIARTIRKPATKWRRNSMS